MFKDNLDCFHVEFNLTAGQYHDAFAFDIEARIDADVTYDAGRDEDTFEITAIQLEVGPGSYGHRLSLKDDPYFAAIAADIKRQCAQDIRGQTIKQAWDAGYEPPRVEAPYLQSELR